MPNEQDRYEPPAECIRAARGHIADVMRSLTFLSTDEAERCVDLLGEAGTQLQSAAAMLNGGQTPDHLNFRVEVEGLRQELKILASALTESDRLVSGWIRRIGTTSGGYTEQGASAQLILMKKVNVTG